MRAGWMMAAAAALVSAAPANAATTLAFSGTGRTVSSGGQSGAPAPGTIFDVSGSLTLQGVDSAFSGGILFYSGGPGTVDRYIESYTFAFVDRSTGFRYTGTSTDVFQGGSAVIDRGQVRSFGLLGGNDPETTIVSNNYFSQSSFYPFVPSFQGFYTLAPGLAAPVPEPASWALMIGGFGIIGGALRRRTIGRAHVVTIRG